MDAVCTPRTGARSQLHVQLQIAGTGPFHDVALELSGRASDLIVFSANGADAAEHQQRTAKVASVSVSTPKSARKGHEFALRVDLSEPDTAGSCKYIIAVKSEAELTQLRHLLNGQAQAAACLFSPPENAERRRMLRHVVERKANKDGRGDWPLPIGTKIAVAGLGVGTYTACTGNRMFANEHTIDFGGEVKTLKLKDVHWTVFEDEMHLFTESSAPRTEWGWQSGNDIQHSWNNYPPIIWRHGTTAWRLAALAAAMPGSCSGIIW
eukprot:COSAG02_NODE_782_length_17259_cov_36.492599_13_plen_266_part_00